MKWLYKLDYKYGKYYIPRFMTIVVAGMAVLYVAQLFLGAQLFGKLPAYMGQSVYGLFDLNREALFHGQVWRLITFIFVPPSSGGFWLLISLYFYYMIGTSLENIWGGFRFNLYYLFGMVGAIISCLIVGYASNSYLNMALFLAFATLAPDTRFMLFFIIPIKAKWMAIFYAVMTAFNVIQAFLYNIPYGIQALVTLGFSLLNYGIFFGQDLIESIRNQIRMSRNRRNWRR